MNQTTQSLHILYLAAIIWLLSVGAAVSQDDYTQMSLPDYAIARFGKGRIHNLAYAPDRKMLAVASSVGVWLYETETWREVDLLPGRARALAFSPSSRILAVAGNAETVTLWDIFQRRVIGSLDGHLFSVNTVTFSPDGQTLATGSFDRTVKLWNVARREHIATFDGHTDAVLSVAFSPDGRYLASGGEDDTVKLWEVAPKRVLATLDGHRGNVGSVAFSPDGQILASASTDGTLKLWDVAKMTELATLSGHKGGVASIAFSPDGGHLVSGSADGTVKLWDVAQMAERTTLKGHAGSVFAVAFSPDGKSLASGSSDETVRLWNVARRQSPSQLIGEIATLKGFMDDARSVARSPDGSILANGNTDGSIRLWDVAERLEIATLKGHTGSPVFSIAFSPDGSTLASGGFDKTIKLWNISKRREIANLEGHRGEVRSIAFSPDGVILASGSTDGTVRLWEVARGRKITMLEGHRDDVRAVAFSPDGAILASGSTDGTVRLWDIARKRETTALKVYPSRVFSIAFAPDGKTLAIGSADGTVKLWKIPQQWGIATLTGHTSSVSSLSFSPDGKTLVSGSWDETVRVWDVPENQEIAALEGHTAPISSIAFTPGTAQLATGSDDGTILLWSLAPFAQTVYGHRFFADIEILQPRFIEPSGNDQLDAGEQGAIAFTLENEGKGVAEAVEVTLEVLTDVAHLTYRERTRIGLMLPGESREVEIPVEASSMLASETVTFRVVINEKWGFEADAFTVTVNTQAEILPKAATTTRPTLQTDFPPKLVISDRIVVDDTRDGKTSYGDSDSQIEVKESIKVEVTVQNISEDTVERVHASVFIAPDAENIYYNSPSTRFELEDIPPGDARQFAFVFSINNRYRQLEAPIKVRVSERTGRYGVTKLLGLKVSVPGQEVIEPQTPNTPPPTASVDHTSADETPQVPDAVAVLFGVEEYLSARPAVFAARDATTFYEFAKSVLGIPEQNIYLATNELANSETFENVLGEDGWLSRRVKPGETEVFFYFSGHGVPAADGPAYLVPHDVDTNSAEAGGIKLTQLYESLHRLQAAHVTIFIDACFSGAGRLVETPPPPFLTAPPAHPADAQTATYDTLTIMTASTGAQVSLGDPNQKQGVFTFYLMEGLRGAADANGDRTVTVDELGAYLKAQIPKKAAELFGREQTPTVQTEVPERALVRFE